MTGTLSVGSVEAFCGIPSLVSGNDTEGATELQASIDGGAWLTFWEFSPGASWTGTSERLPLTATPEQHTFQVRNPATGTTSNVVTFTTAAMITPTYLINADGPTAPTLFAASGTGASQVAFPATQPSGDLSFPVAAAISTGIGVSVANTGDIYYSTYTSSDGTFDSGLRTYFAENDGADETKQIVGVSDYSTGSGVGTATIPLGGGLGVFTDVYFPYLITNGYYYVASSTSINGTIVYNGTCATENIGVLSPGYFRTNTLGSNGTGSVSEYPTLTTLYNFSLVLDPLPPVLASATVTLQGTNDAPLLATGLDFNVDYESTGTGSLTQLIYARAASFTGASTHGGTWTATIGGLSAGLHVVTVRDHNAPMLESNSVTFEVEGPGNLLVSQVTEQTWLERPGASLRVSQAVEQVWLAPVPDARIGLYSTSVLPSSTDTYDEFGSLLSWTYETALLPDNQQQRNNSMCITTLDLAFVGSTPVVAVSFLDNGGNTLQASAITPNGAVSVWNGTRANSTWNKVGWNGAALALSPWQIPWQQPIVFKQGYFLASGLSFAGFKIGSLYLEYKILGYVSQYPSGSS